jgi:Holliday junction DNA helicase RuvB
MKQNQKIKKSELLNSDTDIDFEKSLRPNTFAQVVGREKEKRNLRIMIAAAKKRGEAIDHILFYGPPGLGKTTLAHVVAKELGVDLYITSGPAIEKQGDLASVLTNLPRFGILFIDEIHRLNKSIEEMLYPAMEDGALDIVIGKGPSARTLRLELEKITIIGATTRIGLISSPLRNRFGASFRLDFYSEDELTQLIYQKSDILKVAIDDEAAHEIAKRSRGTARIAIRLLKRVRDFMEVEDLSRIDVNTAQKVLYMHDVDEAGLDYIDRKILEILINDFEGGPVGLSTISAAISEDTSTIEDVYEPFLIQAGFLKRTPRGRIVTKKGYKHIGVQKKNEKNQRSLL